MSQAKKTFHARAIPNTTWRRLRSTPSYFFLTWRWCMWFYALIVIVGYHPTFPNPTIINTNDLLLVITLIQTLTVTLYAPVFQILLPQLKVFRLLQRTRRPLAENDGVDILSPLARTRNPYWDVTIYSLDVLVCGLVTYYSGPFGLPPFGVGSPFYRYGMSTAFASALAYRYRGGLAAAFGYDLFILFGIFFPAPGTTPYIPNVVDIAGSLIDAPIAALLAAYLASLIRSYTQSKRREQDNVRKQRALLSVGETIVREAGNRQRLLQKSAEQLRQGGHFQRLVLALVGTTTDDESENSSQIEIDTCIEINIPDAHLPERNRILLERVISSGQKLITFEPQSGGYGIARIYLPFTKEGQVQMILGAESRRQTSFDKKQENFLTIAGAQLLVALENIHLTEQTIQLAATAERGRIAREIHDGVAQHIYMLSLNTETCATQAHRIAEASEEDAELITPLARRLDTLVYVSKQALWETRNYMFSLKPLMSGTTTLTQMLSNQIREFEAISDLPTHLEVEGTEETPNGDRRGARKHAQVGTTIFRIVQEALTNAYKHADATQIWVHLHHLQESVEVEIRDNGRGMPPTQSNSLLSGDEEHTRIYSGHGLRGMRERAEELGGTVEITQVPTGGVKVWARVPTTV